MPRTVGRLTVNGEIIRIKITASAAILHIDRCCKSRKIIDNFGGKVPETMEELTSLDGVGRKTANIIIGDIYNKNKQDQTLMLSNYPADFWAPYRNNNTYFDRRFKNSFCFY